MKIVQKLIWALIPLLFVSTAFSQGPGNDKERDDKIEALKVGLLPKS